MFSVRRRGEGALMAPSTNEGRLTWPERLKVVSVGLGFLLLFSFLGWLFWSFNPIRNADWIGDGFWEPIEVGRYRVPRGVATFFTLACYLVLIPLALLVFLAGVVHGLQGRRTRLAVWILREMSQREVRKRHEHRPMSAEAESSPAEKVMQSHLPPSVGWGIFLGFMVLAVAVLVWSATRE